MTVILDTAGDPVPKAKAGKWTVVKHHEFGVLEWDPSRVVLDWRHYDCHFRNPPKGEPKKFIKGEELAACYKGTTTTLLGGPFLKFFFEAEPQDLSWLDAWLKQSQTLGFDATLVLLGTEYEAQGGTRHWTFVHRRPNGDIAFDFKSSGGFWPVDWPVLLYDTYRLNR